MYKTVWKSCLLFTLIAFLSMNSFAQKRYIVVEKLGGKRIRLTEGDEFHFKLKGEKAMFNDVVAAFHDSTIIISSGIKISLKNIESVYLPAKNFKSIRIALETIGAGFIILPTLSYFTSHNKYSPKESIIIGSSLILLSQFERLIPHWKKYRMNKKGRIWIVD